MFERLHAIERFCENASYIMVKYDTDKLEGDFGKILKGEEELARINIDSNEIIRSLENKDGSTLFFFDLKPRETNRFALNPISLLRQQLEEAKAIEQTYPNIFRWSYDGLGVKALAVIPSGITKDQTTISRYGGTINFIKILRQQLENVVMLNRGKSPNFHFLEHEDDVEDTLLSLGSINKFNDMCHVQISLKDSYTDILKQSLEGSQKYLPLNTLEMKYWAREANPDMMNETKHITVSDALSVDEGWELYPSPIKKLMMVEDKGNYYRYLLARFLLSVHKPQDAKFVYYSVLSDKERAHVDSGNCKHQWSYIRNNRERYDCPTNKELNKFIDTSYTLSHPLEEIEKYLNDKKENSE